EYPVLARQLVAITQQWKARSFEFVSRLVADYHQLNNAFSADTPLGQFSSLDLESGDSHKKGQQVLIANFTSGVKVVYKPRPISIEKHFQAFLSWFNQKSPDSTFKTLKVIDKTQYGWVEFVPYKQCESKSQLAKFYHQLGCLKAVLFCLRATDFHYENFIACGEQPVAIDLETLFGTNITGNYAHGNCFSVLDIDLLPTKNTNSKNKNSLDASGLGANKNASINSNSWSGGKTDDLTLTQTELSLDVILSKPSDGSNVSDFANEISAGFAFTYQLIAENAEELTSQNGPIEVFLGDTSRFVFKATKAYSDLVWESYHPTFFRSGLQTSKLLDNLWLAASTSVIAEQLIEHEVIDIQCHDIPYFESKIGSNTIEAASGEQVNFKLAETSLNLVKRHIQSFSDNNLKAQLWLINMAIRQTANNAELKKPKQSNPFLVNVTPATQFNCLEQAEKVADLLAEIAIQDNDYAVWAGQFISGEDLKFNYLGSSLYDGQLGIIWFLAHLAKVNRKEHYRKLAEKGLTFCLSNLLEQELPHASIGLFNGLGSYIYVLSHLQNLWPEKDYSHYLKKSWR
ncbi:MAG: type 2 lanthipeptide synthetase LanM, partial [Psychrosphaera sp.]|nr:type 2 lanthipeptide synthetase LanM [Psychrosphaera sp.]